MSKREKRLQRLRQNPKNVSLDDLRRVLEDYDFAYKHSTDSHYFLAMFYRVKRWCFQSLFAVL